MVKVLHRPLPTRDPSSEELHKIINKKKRTKPTKQKKDDLENLLSINEDTITTEDYFKQVHEFFKNQNKKNPKEKNRKQEYIYEKICEVCHMIRDDHLLLLCDYCDDAYHTFCLKPKLEEVPEEEIWTCPVCLKEKKDRFLGDCDENTQMNCGAFVKEVEELDRNASTSTKIAKRQTLLEEHYEVVKSEKEKEIVKEKYF